MVFSYIYICKINLENKYFSTPIYLSYHESQIIDIQVNKTGLYQLTIHEDSLRCT